MRTYAKRFPILQRVATNSPGFVGPQFPLFARRWCDLDPEFLFDYGVVGEEVYGLIQLVPVDLADTKLRIEARLRSDLGFDPGAAHYHHFVQGTAQPAEYLHRPADF